MSQSARFFPGASGKGRATPGWLPRFYSCTWGAVSGEALPFPTLSRSRDNRGAALPTGVGASERGNCEFKVPSSQPLSRNRRTLARPGVRRRWTVLELRAVRRELEQAWWRQPRGGNVNGEPSGGEGMRGYCAAKTAPGHSQALPVSVGKGTVRPGFLRYP